MIGIVVMILVGALAYFAWRHSASQLMRVVANIGGVVAILSVLLAIFGLVLYWRTSAP